jgi:hypothetical protein
MQRCTVMVRLGGNLLSQVERTGVSPAEILVLRHIHGVDAVSIVRGEGNDRGRQDVNEVDRLSQRYKAAFREVFGLNPKLPNTLADIGIDKYGEAEPEVEVAPRRPGRPRKDSGVAAISSDDLAAPFTEEAE